jgi:glycosyltransferase involved in cell wall biosynthesis
VRVLLLSDVPDGWIVSRIADRMVAGMPDIEFERGHYCCMTSEQIVERAAGVGLIHAMNWNFADHLLKVLEAGKPILMSVRSHRYPASVREMAKSVHIHVVNRALLLEFPTARYIPDGIFDEHFGKPFVVGFAGKPDAYKGYQLIEQACRELGAKFVPATNLPPSEMPAYYDSIDVLVCASEAEGFGTPAMEALACNVPVISTRVGAAWHATSLPLTWVQRDVASIKEGILKHWTSRSLDAFRWPAVCAQFEELYRSLATK